MEPVSRAWFGCRAALRQLMAPLACLAALVLGLSRPLAAAPLGPADGSFENGFAGMTVSGAA